MALHGSGSVGPDASLESIRSSSSALRVLNLSHSYKPSCGAGVTSFHPKAFPELALTVLRADSADFTAVGLQGSWSHLWEDPVPLSHPLWCYTACWLPPVTPPPGNTALQNQHTTCRIEDHLSWPQAVTAAWDVGATAIIWSYIWGTAPALTATAAPVFAGPCALWCTTTIPENV